MGMSNASKLADAATPYISRCNPHPDALIVDAAERNRGCRACMTAFVVVCEAR